MQYPKPPIVEALLDIQVTAKAGKSLVELDAFKSKLLDRFPKSDIQRRIVANFIAGDGVEPKVEQTNEPAGYVLRNDDDDKVVQAMLTSFSFSKLKLYANWDEFIGEALELWTMYVKLVDPKEITRIGLRYINRIDIPLGDDYQDYIATAPSVPDVLPQGLSELFMRLSIPNPESELTGVLTQAIDSNSVTKTHYPFILDVDVFKDIALSPDMNLTEIFGKLRDYKNQIFESSITDKAREGFK